MNLENILTFFVKISSSQSFLIFLPLLSLYTHILYIVSFKMKVTLFFAKQNTQNTVARLLLLVKSRGKSGNAFTKHVVKNQYHKQSQ